MAIKEDNIFDIIVVRAKNGIILPGHRKPVNIASVLADSMSKCNLLLRSLMAITAVL
jgi:hypothetical protein